MTGLQSSFLEALLPAPSAVHSIWAERSKLGEDHEETQELGIEDAVVTITGLEKGSHELAAVVQAYNELKQ